MSTANYTTVVHQMVKMVVVKFRDMVERDVELLREGGGDVGKWVDRVV